LGIPFEALTFEEALDLLESFLDGEKNHVIVTPNPEGVMQARRNPEFREALLGADLRLADGTGIVIASRYKKDALPGRVRGVDTIYSLFERGRSLTAYFWGGAPGVAEKAKMHMESRFPNIQVIGYHHGFDEDTILKDLDRLKPDILLVCRGMPRSEIWAHNNQSIPVRLTMCLGGTIDIMAKTAKLPPGFIRKIGLEWLWRLMCQPSRWRRMLDIPRFIWAVIKNGRR